MDHGGSTKVFFAAALFVAAFVATLLLPIPATRESRDEAPVADSGVTATTAAPAALESLRPQQMEMPAEELLTPEDLEDRAWAIAELAASPSPDSVDALVYVLATSSDHRERLAAVEALQRVVASGESSEAARQALQQAANDRHAEVATRARALTARD